RRLHLRRLLCSWFGVARRPVAACLHLAYRLVSPVAIRRSVNTCHHNKLYYVQSGDIAKLPLLCHYPVKDNFFAQVKTTEVE
ncbi:hypothetical protein HN873_039416, partial [Arachis hypogaea]